MPFHADFSIACIVRCSINPKTMKLFFVLTIAVFILYSCGHQKPIRDLSGEWIWASTRTDAKPDSTNPQTPGNTGTTQRLRFAGTRWYKTVNDQLTDSGTYRTSWKKSYDNDFVKAVYFRRQGQSNDSIECFVTYNDTLVFSDMFLGLEGVITTTWVMKKQQP